MPTGTTDCRHRWQYGNKPPVCLLKGTRLNDECQNCQDRQPDFDPATYGNKSIKH